MKIADMHCDTISELYRKRKAGSREGLAENRGHVDLGKLEAGDSLVQNFALFVNLGKTESPWEDVLGMADLYHKELELNRGRIAPVFSYGDIERNRKEGKISALLTVEEGGVCEGKLERLEYLYRLGVRMMTLTWNYPNEIGYPALDIRKMAEERKDGGKKQGGVGGSGGLVPFHRRADTALGLTEKGREFVAEMERLGMMIDVSHLSDAGFYDVLHTTKKPFAASHSNARAVSPWVRNLTDDMIRKLGERGGIIGMNFCPDFLEEVPEGKENPGSIEAVVRHVRHVVHTGGIECVGLGSDFDGIEGHKELPDFSYMPRLAEALRKSGLKEGEVEKICSGNVLRFYKDCRL